MEKNIMLQKPRPFTKTFFNSKELATSIIQGLAIALGSLSVYQYAVVQGFDEDVTRTMVFIVLIVANIFLTLVNRSFYYSILTTLKYKNNLVPLIIGLTIAIAALLLLVPSFTAFFDFRRLSLGQLSVSVLAGSIAALWYEVVKWIKRKK